MHGVLSACRVLHDPNRDWHTETCHPVDDIACDLCLGPLIGQNPSVGTPANDGLVAIHRGFNQAATTVTRAALPGDASILCDCRKMAVALRCRGITRNSCRPGWNDDCGRWMPIGNGCCRQPRHHTRRLPSLRQRRHQSDRTAPAAQTHHQHRQASILRRRSPACRHQGQDATSATVGATSCRVVDRAIRLRHTSSVLCYRSEDAAAHCARSAWAGLSRRHRGGSRSYDPEWRSRP